MAKILYILSGNIATTPRALKTIEVALRCGDEVVLYMVNRSHKWRRLDDAIVAKLQIESHSLSLLRQEAQWDWFMSTLLSKIASMLTKVCKQNQWLNAMASNKVNALYWLNRRRIRTLGVDRVIAFSSMLWPAYYFSKRLGVSFAFDMEDYHPLENIYHRDKNAEIKRREETFVKLLPQAAFVSYASPLIKEKTDELLACSELAVKCGEVINNTFNSADFELQNCSSDKVEFVWFSQTVSYGRGLEQILPALLNVKDSVHLTIIGNMDSRFEAEYLLQYKEILTIKNALPQNELHSEISHYDVGLAIEQVNPIETKDNGNKELCLSNKLFTYLLAGLYIMATDTAAQVRFVETHPDCGIIAGQSTEEMGMAITAIIKNIDSIRQNKATRFAQAQREGWETEQNKLSKLLEIL